MKNRGSVTLFLVFFCFFPVDNQDKMADRFMDHTRFSHCNKYLILTSLHLIALANNDEI